MKFKTLLLSLILVVALSSMSYAIQFKLRALGGVGYTLVTNKVTNADSTKQFAYNFEIQPVISFGAANRVGVGIGLGYMKLWEWKTTTEEAKINAISFRVFFEFSPSIFVLQAGLGLYENQGKYTNTTSPGFGVGFVLAFGAEIPITDVIHIPILTRFDIIEFADYWGTYYDQQGRWIIPVTINAGISFKF